jgi:acylglycerol lipase
MGIKKLISSLLICATLSGCASYPLMGPNNVPADVQEQIVSREEDESIRSFSDQNGVEVRYRCWSDKGEGESIIFLNGLESHGGWFDSIAEDLVKKGHSVYALDRRGSGLNAITRGDYNSWITDVGGVVSDARRNNSSADINLVSLCFGARVATGYAIRNPTDSLVYIAPGFKIEIDLSDSEKNAVAFSVITGIDSPIESPVESTDMFSSDVGIQKMIASDELRTSSPRALDLYQGLLLQQFYEGRIDQINTPSLVFLAGRDRIVNNESTRNFLEGFGRAPKIIQYPLADHTIFFDENYRSQFLDDLEKFIREN